MSKFTAAQLVEFYQKVADGGAMEVERGLSWVTVNEGPCNGSKYSVWRIKQTKKIIDMSHFIKSGIDMEFSDRSNFSNIWVGRLTSTSGSDFHVYACNSGDGHTRYAKFCRPRMNHKMFHDGGECPLPEEFEVVVYFRNAPNGEEVQSNSMDWSHKVNMHDGYSDIIGYEILGLADGWAYPWEQTT